MSIGIAIIGTGAFAEVHAEAIAARPDCKLRYGVSRDIEAAQGFAARTGAEITDRIEVVLDASDVQLVVIATPHDAHEEPARQVLQAGRHVLVEKPLTHDVASANRLVAAANEAEKEGVVCTVGHVMRFAPAYKAAKRLLQSGAIGEVVHVESRSVIGWDQGARRDWHRSAAAGGGMWLTQGTHVIDRVSWLLDDRAEVVAGTGRVAYHPGEQDADDFGAALLRFGSGVTAQLTIAGFRNGVTDVGTLIHGTEGMLRVSHRGELMTSSNGGWIDRSEEIIEPGPWRSEMMKGEWDAVIAGVTSGISPISPDYGRYVVELACAAIGESNGTQRL